MPPVTINASDAQFLEQIQGESRQVTSDGAALDITGDQVGDAPYGTFAAPVKDFNQYVVPGGELDHKVTDALRTANLAMARRLRQLNYHVETVSANLVYTVLPTALATIDIAPNDRLQIVRKALITVNFSGQVTVDATRIGYWIDVDGVETAHFRYLFPTANQHVQMGGNWLVTLPAGTTTITLKAVRETGTGIVIHDSNDFISMTLWG